MNEVGCPAMGSPRHCAPSRGDGARLQVPNAPVGGTAVYETVRTMVGEGKNHGDLAAAWVMPFLTQHTRKILGLTE